MIGPMTTEPALQVDGVSLIDPTRLWFYGNSQGAVLGGGYGAMPAVARVGPEGGRHLVAETVKLIDKLFPAQP